MGDPLTNLVLDRDLAPANDDHPAGLPDLLAKVEHRRGQVEDDALGLVPMTPAKPAPKEDEPRPWPKRFWEE